jgi:predicted O-methyltransferase YrrM
MSGRTIFLNDVTYSYLLGHSLREPAHLLELRKETGAMPNASMQISPEQGQFMSLLVKMLGVKKALEIGVFTGYSSVAIATSLAEQGVLVACDISEEFTQVAKKYWAKAGVANKIHLHIGPALQTLDRLIAKGERGTFDFVFIDAAKEEYEQYFEKSLNLVRRGGVILIDNVLWGGNVADPQVKDPETMAIRRFNEKRKTDDRIEMSMIPLGDGLTLCRKK